MPDPTPIARICIVNITRTTYNTLFLMTMSVSRRRILPRRAPRATKAAIRRGIGSISPREIEPPPLRIAAFIARGPLRGSIRRRLPDIAIYMSVLIGGPRVIHDGNTGDGGGVGHGLNAGCAGLRLPIIGSHHSRFASQAMGSRMHRPDKSSRG